MYVCCYGFSIFHCFLGLCIICIHILASQESILYAWSIRFLDGWFIHIYIYILIHIYIYIHNFRTSTTCCYVPHGCVLCATDVLKMCCAPLMHVSLRFGCYEKYFQYEIWYKSKIIGCEKSVFLVSVAVSLIGCNNFRSLLEMGITRDSISGLPTNFRQLRAYMLANSHFVEKKRLFQLWCQVSVPHKIMRSWPERGENQYSELIYRIMMHGVWHTCLFNKGRIWMRIVAERGVSHWAKS